MNKVTLLTPDDDDAYDRFIAETPGSMLYYTRRYRAFLESALELKSEYWINRKGDRITAVLPLFIKEGPLGKVINSLPLYGSHGGALASDEVAAENLMDWFSHVSREEEVALAMFVENPFKPMSGDFKFPDEEGMTLRDERIGQMTIYPDDIAGDQEAIESTLLAMWDGSTRRNIKKAIREGVTVAVENGEFDFLYDVHRENMAAIKGNAKKRIWFDAFAGKFRPDLDFRLYVARIADEPVAGLLVAYHGEMVEYLVPVTRLKARDKQPMAAILDTAMTQAALEGKNIWNWGGTWKTQDGVYRFKKKWGARDFPYRYFILLRDNRLLEQNRNNLLTWYPDFYTVPFDALKPSQGVAL